MVDIFDDGGESFEDLPYGHHLVTLTVLEKNGEQFVKETPSGPRVTFKLKAVDGSGSVLAGQTFNAKTTGLLSGINACFDFTKEQANEMVTVAPTETTFDMASLHRLCALWASSSGGWIEVKPGEGKYPEVSFRKGEPGTKRTAADYVTTNGSGESADIPI